ncbi:MAG TPA: hypothetical protein VKC59_07975, partial [Candidatus Limnocylindrales bacterium]|nr:hypothetical protein [Candidatus Limnocylindrales bacterium]
MTGPSGAWDDTRIDAAFRSRYDAAPPAGLADRITTDLESQRPMDWLNSWRRSTLGVVAAATVVAAVLIGSQLGFGQPGPGASGPGPTAPEFSPPPIDAGGSFPPTVIQYSSGRPLPVLSVAEAAYVRDTGVDSREIAVGGWYLPS